MKKAILVIAFLLFTSTAAQATLIDNGDGTITDDDFGINGIMWLANANLAATETFGVQGISANGTMNWDTANSWIDAMNASNYLEYSDWRLPLTVDDNSSLGFGVTTSEMGHLYYTELGGNLNTGYFQNLVSGVYVSGTVVAGVFDNVWDIDFGDGKQNTAGGSVGDFFVLAVRDIPPDPIPEPATFLLLGIGLVGLAGAEVRRRWKKKAVVKG